MITGRCASASSDTAVASAAASGSPGPATDGSVAGSPSSGASENTWSSGKSTNAGPPGGRSAAQSASSTSDGISPGAPAVAAKRVSGRTNGTWSISCSEPCPQRQAGARPPSTTIGEWLASAAPSALIPFVTPGPAVRAATPGRRVTFAHASAANAAVASWRVSTSAMPSVRQPS
jgi:hypothetical protein